MKRRFLVAPFLIVTSGCALGPDHAPPALATMGDWIEPANPGDVSSRWWHEFDDPVLTGLIQRALESGPDTAEAEARLAEARANRDAAAGGRLPRAELKGAATQNRMSENGAIPVSRIPGFQRDYGLFDLGFDASWEIDIWGKRRREVDAASAREDAALATRQDVMLMLAAEVARNYVELRSAQADIGFSRDIANADAEIAKLMKLRFEAGEASRTDTESAQGLAEASASRLPLAQARAAAAAYSIAALIGESPGEVAYLLESATPLPQGPEEIAAGLRSDILTRRPDVRRAERELAAATASVGSAKADMFPRFSLVGSFGQQSRTSDALLDGTSTRFSVGPAFSWPIFAGGTIRAQVRAADARADAAAARYEKAVMGALADSETAANRFASTVAADGNAHRALENAKAVYGLAEQRERSGEDDRLALMRARKSLAETQRGKDSAALARAQAAIALFKSLGGGWEKE